MGKCAQTEPNRTPLNWWQRFVLLLYVALFGAILPFICWGALGMPGHPHAAPHFVFLPPPAHSAGALAVTDPVADPIAATHMAMNAANHQMATADRSLAFGCLLADHGGLADVALHRLLSDATPAGQAYPSFLAVTLMLLIGLALALLTLPIDHRGFRRWLAALLLSNLRIPTPPPRYRPFSA